MQKKNTYSRLQRLYGFVMLLLPLCNVLAQKDTSTHKLNEVLIQSDKANTTLPSKTAVHIDSVTLEHYRTNSLAELLSNQSAIHIKSYGNGNIATSSIRGGNAAQTAVLWNGLNIQNPLLGQTDLSLLQSSLFDDVTLEYGSSSANYGSGSVGGNILLQNKVLFSQGIKTRLQMAYGSFDNRKVNSAVQLSYRRFISNTKVYSQDCKNNYLYYDRSTQERVLKQNEHADYSNKGLMQELYFIPFNNHKFSLRFWYNSTFRNLPVYTKTISRQHQDDKNLKANVEWEYSKRAFSTILRGAFFNDHLDYTDSTSRQFNKNTTNTIIAENINNLNYKHHHISSGLNYTFYGAAITNRINRFSSNEKDSSIYHNLSKLAVFVTYRTTLLNERLLYNLNIRKEFSSQMPVPFTGSTGLAYKLHKLITLKADAAKGFRQPSLSDLYYFPGGNPNLKPEDSYGMEGGVELRYNKSHYSVSFEGTYFNRHTKNWILWLPTSMGYPSPVNIAEVYSRGTETKTELAYRNKEWLIRLSVFTAYTLSTNQKAAGENDNSKGRQLVYTPRYTGQASLTLCYKEIRLLFNSNYTGYRFTSTDNSSWLEPYYLANLKLSWAYQYTNFKGEFFGSINNLFNKDYMVVQNVPMAMRNYEAGITLQYHKKSKSITPNNP